MPLKPPRTMYRDKVMTSVAALQYALRCTYECLVEAHGAESLIGSDPEQIRWAAKELEELEGHLERTTSRLIKLYQLEKK